MFSDVSMMLFVFDVASEQQEVFSNCIVIRIVDRLGDLSKSDGASKYIQFKRIGLCVSSQDG